MDFFKSVFSDEPEPVSSSHSNTGSPIGADVDPKNPNPPPTWSFGGLVKNLAIRSESVIETYRRDLEEFRSGLRKESEVLRDVASRAVRDLPSSLELGASAAQESFESVGHVIDEFGSTVWRSTGEIISQGKDAILDAYSDSSKQNSIPSSNSKPYSRFEVQLTGVQSDPATYTSEPDDLEDFKKWESEFHLEEKAGEIEILREGNGDVYEIYAMLVPSVVDHETFWRRYFYRTHKFNLAEDVRTNMLKRANSREDDEELSWEVGDSDEGEISPVLKSSAPKVNNAEVEGVAVSAEEMSTEGIFNSDSNSQKLAAEKGSGSVKELIPAKECGEKLKSMEKEKIAEPSSDKSLEKSDALKDNNEAGESSKDSYLTIVSAQQSGYKEEDLGWDEIEDLSSIDEKKLAIEARPNKEYLCKRAIAMEEDEDLSWDIEDDEPAKR